MFVEYGMRLQNDANEVPENHKTIFIFRSLFEKLLGNISLKLDYAHHVVLDDLIESCVQFVLV